MGRHPKYTSDLGDPDRYPIRAQLRAALEDDERSILELSRQASIPSYRLYHFLSDAADLELIEVDRLARTMGFTLVWTAKPSKARRNAPRGPSPKSQLMPNKRMPSHGIVLGIPFRLGFR